MKYTLILALCCLLNSARAQEKRNGGDWVNTGSPQYDSIIALLHQSPAYSGYQLMQSGMTKVFFHLNLVYKIARPHTPSEGDVWHPRPDVFEVYLAKAWRKAEPKLQFVSLPKK